MKRTSINLSQDKSRGIDALKGGVPAVFCDAVRIDLADHSLLYISGKTGIDANNKMVGRTMREQTEQVLENIKAVLDREGATFDDIVRVRVYVTQCDQQSLRDVHEARAKYFRPGHYPASTLVRVSQLVRDGGLVEIDADAVLSRSQSGM